MAMDLMDTLLVLETRGWEALSHAGRGAPFYDEVLSDDALMVFPFGVMNRADSVAAIRSSTPWARYRIEEPRVIELSEDCAMLLYKVTARRTGQPTFVAMINSTYVKRDGAWKLRLHQQSPNR
jgi:hypothetical protein